MQSFIKFLENREKEYDFSSILYILPDKIAKKVYNWSLDNIKDKDLAEKGREEEIHVTVMYGIHSKLPTSSRKILSETKPFEIKLGKITAFTTSDKYDVLKIHVIGSELHKLHNNIKTNLEVTESYPEYKPHITIAYLAKGKADKYVGDDEFEGITIKVDNATFSSNAGVKTKINFKE